MSFWRKDAIGSTLGGETIRQIDGLRAWIGREPANPLPYYHLAQFYRMENRTEQALGLLLEAVRLDATFAEAHAALTEIYAIRADYPAAWRHARGRVTHASWGGRVRAGAASGEYVPSVPDSQWRIRLIRPRILPPRGVELLKPHGVAE
jgi:tetratricopeptide (TPR) repeat protein